MGNLFGKECHDLNKKPKKRPSGIRWKPPGDDGDDGGTTNVSSTTFGGMEKASKLDPKDFIFSRKQKEVLTREPGSIGGQQFIVEECSECEVYLLDHTAALTIDVCTDCRVFAGPCESSVFIRDCKDCTVVVACQQFRARDCTDCTFFLFSATQPVIESSLGLRFACYTLDYFSLAGQFAAANLSVWNNKWSQVFNFTGGEGDWSCLPRGAHHRDFTTNSLPATARHRVGYTDNTHGAVVPITAGIRGFVATEEETCFIVVMPIHIDAVLGKLLAVGGRRGKSPKPSSSSSVASAAPAASAAASSRLLRTKFFQPHPTQSKSFFSGAPAFVAVLASSTPVLGMQWAGPGSTEAAVSLLAAAGVAVPASPAPTPAVTPLPPTSDDDTGIVAQAVQKTKKATRDASKAFPTPGWVETGQYFMASGRFSEGDGGSSNEISAAMAKVFFDVWEDKGISLQES